MAKKKKNKNSKSLKVVDTLKQICEIKGWTLIKCCKELGIPKKQNNLTTKQVSGYNSRAVEYLGNLKREIKND